PIEKGLDQVWAKALKKAGLRHRPSYQLRHTFASLCIQQGIAPGWVAQTLGHTSLEMTFCPFAAPDLRWLDLPRGPEYPTIAPSGHKSGTKLALKSTRRQVSR